MSTRYWIKGCFGINPRTGKRVGERHRWVERAWGVGRCLWCYRYLDDLRYPAEVKPAAGSDLHLAQALRKGE